MDQETLKETLVQCFVQKKSCLVTLKEGDPVTIVADTLNIFGKNEIKGKTSKGDWETIPTSNIENVEMLEATPPKRTPWEKGGYSGAGA